MSDSEAMARTRLEVFWRLHRDLPKQGPGDDATTLRALDAIGDLGPTPRILDLGCGPGRQTLALLEATNGTVRAIDVLPPFLEQLDRAADEREFGERVETRVASMGALEKRDYPDGCADLVWSEGAIYNIGFDAGLAAWRRLLRPGGAVAVTEATWLDEPPTARVKAFWETELPTMRSVEANRRGVEATGYALITDFVVPEQSWWDDYYTPIATRLDTLRGERDDAEWRAVVAAFDEELDIVREGLGSFGYVFYVARRPGDD